jgi:ribonucleoside-diphosphate reductase alpha chain
MKSFIEKVRKRDGRLEPFDPQKIVNAIYKALKETGEGGYELAKELADEVVVFLNQKFAGQVPSVEEIQDVVEDTLIRHGLTNTAKAYILYRRWRTSIRETKRFLGVEDDLKLSINAVRVLARRYLLRDEQGRIVETPGQMFARVARAIAKADVLYGLDPEKSEKYFFQVMRNLEFLPNSPTLMNAGTEIGQLAACFVIPVEDSIEGIFDALKYMAVIHKSGGGTGFSFSRLRPKGDVVRSTMGVASGPVSFMKIFDVATEVIKQGGKRRGANMGVLRVDHPDIREFVMAKSDGTSFRNFNLSVAVTDKFMQAVEAGGSIDLINPRTKEPVKSIDARDLFELMVDMAWRSGDPGLLFIDEINRKNPTPKLGEIEATNPCGEVPLLPFEACNLGSINLSKVVKNG